MCRMTGFGIRHDPARHSTRYDVLDFVKKYHTVGFDYDKEQENFEYHEYLIATYFEYYVNGPESLLDFLEHKIDIINDVSSNNIHCRHDSQYYLNLLK